MRHDPPFLLIENFLAGYLLLGSALARHFDNNFALFGTSMCKGLILARGSFVLLDEREPFHFLLLLDLVYAALHSVRYSCLFIYAECSLSHSVCSFL